MTAEFWITTAAILIGPVVAVVISQYLQQRSEKTQRRLFVFRALMTTRRNPLSPERVQALNLVEVEFHGKRKIIEKFQELLKVYGDHVRWKSDDEVVRKEVIQEVDDLTAKLLREIGLFLGYKLENLDLLRGGYYPEAFTVLEAQQAEIREFFAGLNKGSKALPTAVLDVRHPADLLQQARESQQLINFASAAENAQAQSDTEKND